MKKECPTCKSGAYCTNHYHKHICSCGNEFLGKKQSKFCSRECAGKLNGWKVGAKTWNKGKKGLQKAWNKGMIGFNCGEKSGRWIKDRTKLAKHQERNDMAYKDWRNKVRKRDGWKCRINSEHCKGKVIAHHILPWIDYPEERYNINNGITLCQAHHPRKRAEEKRLIPFFMGLVPVSN